MYFLSDVSDNIEFARGRDKMKRKHKGSMLLHGIGAGIGVGAIPALGLALLEKRRTGRLNIGSLNRNAAIGGLVGAGVGGVLGETVLNKKLGLEGTNFKDTVWDRKSKFWNHNKK